MIEAFADCLGRVIPQRRGALNTPEAALFWMEWRCAGLLLPAAVLFTTMLILGPILWCTGRGADETLCAVMWLAVLPVMLAFPVGKGFGKPDFWSLELALPLFVATRPISGGQIVAGKMKAAACSTLISWGLLLAVAPLWIYLSCNTEHIRDIWQIHCTLYSPVVRWIIPLLTLLAGIVLTWSLLIGSMWLGMSGRPAFCHAAACQGIAVFLAFLILFAWWVEHPQQRGEPLVGLLAWIPWLLAAAFTGKTWSAVLAVREAHRRRLISKRTTVTFACFWIAVTGILVLLSWLLSPAVEWFR